MLKHFFCFCFLVLSVFGSLNAVAVDVKKNEVSTREGNVDWDFEFTLTTSEISDLNSDEGKSFIISAFTAIAGPEGTIAAKYVIEYANDVRSKAGPRGAWVKTTIRNEGQLHVWEVYPL